MLFSLLRIPLTTPRRIESADKSDKSVALQTLRVRPSHWTTRQRLECVRLKRRFPNAHCVRSAGRLVEIPFSVFRVHCDHEPVVE